MVGEDQGLDKRAFIEEQQAQVTDWRGRLDALRARSNDARWRDREDYNQRVAELHFELKEIEQKIIELKLASQAKTEAMGRQIESAWSGLQSSFQSFAQTFGDTVDVATVDPARKAPGS
mgnify:CR=1 FL=1